MINDARHPAGPDIRFDNRAIIRPVPAIAGSRSCPPAEPLNMRDADTGDRDRRPYGFPEILDGRVKTLHPKVHGGILGKRSEPDLATMEKHDIDPIDLDRSGLSPRQPSPRRLRQRRREHRYRGPAMIRSAENHDGVTIVTDAEDARTR